MTLGKTSISLLTFFTVFDLDRLMAYPITSYDYDFNLDLNPGYVPMNEWLMRPTLKDGESLPSPANLKRWRITTETMSTLCSKDVCTTAHILGACKVSLQQGRYTFRDDTVLREVIEVLKTLILNIKDTVPISPKSSISL